MRYAWMALALLLTPTLPAQIVVPAGTVLPLQLETGLNARHARAGEMVRAEVMQNIPGTTIHRGAQVLGRVVSVTPTTLTLRFDTLVANRQRTPLHTNLRAIAGMMAVDEAQIPEEEASRGLTPETWTTQQIGGDMVYRGGGPVARGMDYVGEPTPYGARGKLTANSPCRGAVAGDERPQALWLFSTNACGAYGFEDLTVAHFGRTGPVGNIELVSKTGKLNIRSGSGLLLRVTGS